MEHAQTGITYKKNGLAIQTQQPYMEHARLEQPCMEHDGRL